ncbi:uncharacterized protein LOC141642978 isoform X2 [Silene latifolia]|uniref:uncharacterized protein LOC141642978 isoform X2 n=1 Tax=Silene latifolia TaxID=37657 RepID=UPI003D789B1A
MKILPTLKYVACSAAEKLALNAKDRREFTHLRGGGFGSMGVNGSSACVAGQSTTFSSRESRGMIISLYGTIHIFLLYQSISLEVQNFRIRKVKLRIKSFCVPKLLIEMPETASIGSLKRTVMKSVSASLGGGLLVGVFLQGKKIRDDNITLVQSGPCTCVL